MGKIAEDPAHGRVPSRKLIWALSAACGVLLVFAFPRMSWSPLAWVGLAGWLWLLCRVRFSEAILSGLVLGAIFFGGLIFWVTLFGFVPWVLLALVQSLFVAAAGAAIWLMRGLGGGPRILGAAAAWTALEWLRGVGPFGFTWGGLGYSQSGWLDFIQMAGIVGVPGITFLIVAHNAALAHFFEKSSQGRMRRAAAMVLVWAAIGVAAVWGRLARGQMQPARSVIKAAVIQPSVKDTELARRRQARPGEGAIPEVPEPTRRLMEAAAKEQPEIMVLPESELPFVLVDAPGAEAEMRRLAKEAGAWVVTGSILEDDAQNTYNTAYLFSPEGEIAGHYEKVQLVPFGEFVPGRKWLPGLQFYPIRDYDLTPGPGFSVLRAGKARPGVSICFESTFPHIAREFVREGANLLVVITNDGWFKETAAPAQHEKMAVLRAVENRRWVLRAASTGISCVISPEGLIVNELALNERDFMVEPVALEEGISTYTRRGDWFVAVCWAVTILCIGFGRRRRKRE